MNKKQSITGICSTPKGISKTIRTLSQNSSSSSIKPKIVRDLKSKIIDKQNQSQNFLLQQNKRKNEDVGINKFKGLKRIKQKVQKQQITQNNKQKQRQLNYKADKPKFSNTKILQKNNSQNHSQNHSSRSLLINKSNKNQSDKKSSLGIISQKQTPKNNSKKFINTKFITKKTQPQISFNTIINQSEINYQESRIQQTIINEIFQEKKQIKIQPQKQIKKGLMISMFKIKGKICDGAFSTTFEVIHIQTGFIFCLKVFQKNKIKQQGLQEQLIQQIKFRNNMKNKNLQSLYGFFHDQVYIYFIEQYLIGFGSLQKQLQIKRKFNEKQSGLIFKQTLQIVRYIHSFNYIHRDIRLTNLVKCLGIIKLIDFSWVASLRHKKQRDTFCGTYKYAPPELLQGQNYDQSIDIWSLGILLYELCTGQSPFNQGFGKRSSQAMNFPIFLSNQLVDIIGRLLSEKGARMRIEEIMMHEWINKWDLDGLISKEFWDFWVL